MVSKLDGLSGGSSGSSSSGNCNGKGNNKKQQQRQKEEKTHIPIFKYSERFRGPLHEAILLSGEPFFLTWDPDKQKLNLVRDIEERTRVLVPPGDGEYPYEPIEFASLMEMKDYVEMALNETIDSLFIKIRNVVSLYVDQDDEIIILIAADILWTFFQDLFPTTHYYDIYGKTNGIGKSTIGYVFQGTGYRGVRMTDPSGPNFFRVLKTIEPGQCIIIADEADRIHKDRETLSILKEGYAIDGRVAKINGNTFKQEFFYSYSFKIRIAEESLRGDITKGVTDRCFMIRAIKGKPTYDIKEILQPANRNEKFEKLHNDLRHLRKLLLTYRLIHFKDRIPDIETTLDGRDKELCKPLLQLFHGSKSYNEIRQTLMKFLDRKNKRKRNIAIEPQLFQIVVNLIAELGTQIQMGVIWRRIKDIIPGVEDPKRPAQNETEEYGTLYRDVLSKSLEDFGADHDKIKNVRLLTFDIDKLVKVGKAFDLDVIVDKGGVRGVRGVQSLKDENITNNEDDYIRNEKEASPIQDNTIGSPNNTPSTPSTPSTPHMPIYRIRPDGDQYGCNNCKLKGDKWFMQDHPCRGERKE